MLQVFTEVYIAHVVSSVGYKMVGPDAEVAAAEVATRDLKELWDKLGGVDESRGVELALIVRRGDVCSELEELIHNELIDLVVVGTRGRTGVSKVMLGSVAEEIFRKVSCPVLTEGQTRHEIGRSGKWEPKRSFSLRPTLEMLLLRPCLSQYRLQTAVDRNSSCFMLTTPLLPTDPTPIFGQSFDRVEEEILTASSDSPS